MATKNQKSSKRIQAPPGLTIEKTPREYQKHEGYTDWKHQPDQAFEQQAGGEAGRHNVSPQARILLVFVQGAEKCHKDTVTDSGQDQSGITDASKKEQSYARGQE